MNRFHALVLIAVLVLQSVRALGAPVSELQTQLDRAAFRALDGTDWPYDEEIDNLEQRLDRAEARASDSGRAILKQGRAMVAAGDIVIGSCWDYIQAVYNRAGYPSKERATPFQGKKVGPFANLSEVQPGDWLYYINHSYGDVEHSGVFVDWYDFSKQEAIILSYPGQNRKLPGRYKLYDLGSIFNIIRPKVH